jgi:hypothetical protein
MTEIEYKNYKITQDKYCYILAEYWDIVNKKTKEVKYWIINEIYPVSLENCLKRVLEWEKSKIGKVEITEIISELQKMQKEFIDFLEKLLIKNEI